MDKAQYSKYFRQRDLTGGSLIRAYGEKAYEKNLQVHQSKAMDETRMGAPASFGAAVILFNRSPISRGA
jgi:hypothetical protein